MIIQKRGLMINRGGDSSRQQAGQIDVRFDDHTPLANVSQYPIEGIRRRTNQEGVYRTL